MGSVLVINSGSSSLKFKLFTKAAERLSAVVTGLVERIGDTDNSQLVATNTKDETHPGKAFFKVHILD
jgi:acetate kinase